MLGTWVREPLLATGPEPALAGQSPVRHTPVTLPLVSFPRAAALHSFQRTLMHPSPAPKAVSKPSGSTRCMPGSIPGSGIHTWPLPKWLLLGWHSSTHKLCGPRPTSLLQPWLPPAHKAAPAVHCEDAAQSAPTGSSYPSMGLGSVQRWGGPHSGLLTSELL